jgi:PAS domain S-box-containing protein
LNKANNIEISFNIEFIKQNIRLIAFAFFSLSTLPVFVWIIDLIFSDLDISLESLWQIHLASPIHFFIDFIPFVFAFVIAYYRVHTKSLINNYEQRLREKEGIIDKNALLAINFGNGIYEINEDSIDNEDLLQRALITMRDNLLLNKKKESELNWISRGKEVISNTLRTYNSIDKLTYHTLFEVVKYADFVQGALYLFDESKNKLVNTATYAFDRRKYINQEFSVGQGLIGQAAFEMGLIYRTEIPEDYVTLTSGILGDSKPSSILIVPLISDEKLQGIIELASAKNQIPELTIKFIEEISEIIARTIFNLKINSKTKDLLTESQLKTEELKRNEEQLKLNAEEVRATKDMLEVTNKSLEQKVVEIENAQKRLHTLLENASEVISIFDSNKIVKYESPSVERILGYKAEEIVGHNAFERVHPDTRDKLEKVFNEVINFPWKISSVEFQYKKGDGNFIWLQTVARNMLKENAIKGIIFNTRDITQHKVAEKEQRMRGQMQSLSENSPDIIIRLSLKGDVFYVNPMIQSYTGIKPQMLLKKNIDVSNIDPQVILFFRSTIDKIIQNKQKFTAEVDFPSELGNRIMQVNCIPELNSEDNQLESVLFVAHDVTERKQIELEIQEKNKKITESINYAEHIQVSILPNTKYLQEYIPKSFILYKPKDVVSGDFPWFFRKGDNIYVAAVDCTGHGVPGAMLSLIGYFLLNNIVDHDREISAAEILDILHVGVRRTLRQDTPDAEARDGMDIALCKLNYNTMKMEYAGAHRPLICVRAGEITEIKADRKAIGGIPLKGKVEKSFTNHEIQLEADDKYFIFSDGLPDQIGGPEKKKYSSQRVRSTIEKYSHFSIEAYADVFKKDFDSWKGDEKQIDDILLIGIEI